MSFGAVLIASAIAAVAMAACIIALQVVLFPKSARDSLKWTPIVLMFATPALFVVGSILGPILLELATSSQYGRAYPRSAVTSIGACLAGAAALFMKKIIRSVWCIAVATGGLFGFVWSSILLWVAG